MCNEQGVKQAQKGLIPVRLSYIAPAFIASALRT